MLNQQLVDYIKQQLQGGVANDAVKKALLEAGWPEADVAEAMNAASASSPQAAAPAAATPVAAAKPATVNLAGAMGSMAASPEVRPVEPLQQKAATLPVEHAKEAHGRQGLLPMIVMGSVIVVLLAALGYVYFSLSGKLANANNAGAGAPDASEVAELQNQVKSLTDEKTNMADQLAALGAEQQQLMAEVSFFALPSSGSLSQDIEGKAKGTLSGGGTIPYVITTSHQLRVYVKNWKDAKVDAALKPLLGTTVEVAGMHKPTSPDLTVTTVNGAPVNPPAAPAATSTTP